MKKFRDLNACVAVLQAIQVRDDVQPEQQKELAEVVNAIRALRRKKHIGKPEAFEAIREITERLLRAFKH